MERTGLLGMFLLVSTSALSVMSIFLPGSPFITWISSVEKDEGLSQTYQLEKTDVNIAHITVLMIGIILARFG